jgi:two-component system sensor histidine kinase YesM
MKIANWLAGSLSRRMLFYMLIVLSVQAVLTGLISYRWILSSVEEVIASNMQDVNKSLVQEANSVRINHELLADRIMANSTIQDLLLQIYSGDGSYQISDTRRIIEWFLWEPENSSHMIIVDARRTIYQSYTSSYMNLDYAALAETGPFKKALESNGGGLWEASQRNILTGARQPSLYLCKTINCASMDYPNMFLRGIGQLIIKVPYDVLGGIFERSGMAEGEYFAVVDSDGRYVYHTLREELIGERVGDDLRFFLDGKTDASASVSQNGSDMLVQYSPYTNRGVRRGSWNVLHAIPASVAASRAMSIRNIMLVVMMLLLVVSIPLMLFFFNTVKNPIVRLSGAVSALGSASLRTRIAEDRHDEIGRLQASFNAMAGDIEKLLRETDDNHRKLRQFELDTLEYQINPHFLYNSLDSINWMAQRAGNADIEEMVAALARFLRVGLSRGHDFYRVRDELEHARLYLLINKIRFKDSFAFAIDAQDGALERPILKILLQPIVENALKYGAKNGRGGGHGTEGEPAQGAADAGRDTVANGASPAQTSAQGAATGDAEQSADANRISPAQTAAQGAANGGQGVAANGTRNSEGDAAAGAASAANGRRDGRGGGFEISISARLSGGDVLLTVTDTGAGMASAQLARLRGALERRELFDESSDSGFGLYNVTQRLWLHYGGKAGISVESELGQGTSVTVRVPAAPMD